MSSTGIGIKPKVADSLDSGSGINPPNNCTARTAEEAERRLLADYFIGKAARVLPEVWDQWLNPGVGIQMAATHLELADGSLIKFTKVRWFGPRITPKMAWETGSRYLSTLRAEASHVVNGIVKRTKEFKVGDFPLMTGSRLCLSRLAKSDAELEAMGFDPLDPPGWFILDGGSIKKFNGEKQLRFKRVFVYTGPRLRAVREGQQKVALQARLTYAKPLGNTSIAYAEVTPDRKIMCYFPFLDKRMEKEKTGESALAKASLTMPIFSIIRLFNLLQEGNPLGTENTTFLGIEDYMNQILRMSPPEWHARMRQELQPSLVHILGSEEFREDEGIADDFKYYREQTKLNMTDRLLAEKFRAGFRDSFSSYIQPKTDNSGNIINNYMQERFDTFCFFIARLVEVMADLRKPDDRNHWSNNRVTFDHMKKLFANAWGAKINKIQNEKARDTKNFDDIVGLLEDRKPYEISEDIASCFRTGKWGIGTRNKKENVTVPLKQGNLTAVYSDLLRIRTIQNEKSRDLGPRQVIPDALGIQDPNDTPESGQCGLVNSLTIGATLSIERDERPIRIALLEHIYQTAEEGRCVCICNGVMIGWCLPELENIAREWRRARKPVDLEVVREHDVIFVYSDEAKPLRPLLIIDPVDRKLMIQKVVLGTRLKDGTVVDQKPAWEATFDELLRVGCVEMISPWEQTWNTTVATRFSNVLDWERKVAEMNNQRDLFIKEIQILESFAGGTSTSDKEITQEELEEIRKMTEETVRLSRLQGKDISEVEETLSPAEKSRQRAYWAAVDTKNLNKEVAAKHLQREIASRKLMIIDLEKDKHRLTTRQVDGRYVIKRPYTHAELNPRSILSTTAALIPLSHMNPSVRTSYECKQSTQAIGILSSIAHALLGTTMKSLVYPRRGLIETELMRVLGYSERPTGDTVFLGIADQDSWPQEDSYVMNRDLFDLGYFAYYTHKTYFVELINDKSKEGVYERIRKPKRKPGESKNRLDALNDQGLPMIHSIIMPKMVIVGKVRLRNLPSGKEDPDYQEDASLIAGPNDLGYVEKVIVVKPRSPETMQVTVVLRRMRVPRAGDKFSTNPGQKGTLSYVADSADMPQTQSGRPLDILMNPLAFTTRMTMGLLLEPIASTLAATIGKRVDASTFMRYDRDDFERLLREVGFNFVEKQKMVNPHTGKHFECSIFAGPAYLKMLAHNVLEKIRSRAEGRLDPVTRQPIGGTAKDDDSGIKFGEMERDAMIAHGAAFLTRERLYFSSDRDHMPFCIPCGTFAIANIRAKGAEGEIRCRTCNNNRFGEVELPHIYKVFLDIMLRVGIRYFHHLVPKKRAGRIETIAERRKRGEQI